MVDSSEYIVDRETQGAPEIPSPLMGEGKGEGIINAKLRKMKENEMRNSKSEILNPKQYQNPNDQNSKLLIFSQSVLFRTFEFRKLEFV